MPPIIVRVDADGSMREIEMHQRELHEYVDGQLTFAGAISSLDAFLLAGASDNGTLDIPEVLLPIVDFPCVSPIYIIGSDAEGREQDVRLCDVRFFLSHARVRR